MWFCRQVPLSSGCTPATLCWNPLNKFSHVIQVWRLNYYEALHLVFYALRAAEIILNEQEVRETASPVDGHEPTMSCRRQYGALLSKQPQSFTCNLRYFELLSERKVDVGCWMSTVPSFLRGYKDRAAFDIWHSSSLQGNFSGHAL